MNKLQRDTQFLYEIGCLRHIQRTWKQFLNPDFANLSEHTLRVIWIALAIAQYEKKVDTGKLVKMALTHDLSESRGVDVHYVSREFVERHEDKAFQATVKDTSLQQELNELISEYEAHQSLEAKIVKDADNLDVDFELQEQTVRGFTLSQKFASMRKQVRDKKLYTKTAQKMWDEIYNSDPHDWHWQSTNRFNSGDWKL